MDGQMIAWGVALALAIDVAMFVFAWRRLARRSGRSGQTRAEHSACESLDDDDEDFDSAGRGGDLPFDDDDEVCDPVRRVGYSHCPRVNPATGLPMLDGAVDVAGNPDGTDLGDFLGSSDSDYGYGGLEDFSGSSHFDSGCGGLDDFSGSSDFDSGCSGLDDW